MLITFPNNLTLVAQSKQISQFHIVSQLLYFLTYVHHVLRRQNE